MNSCKTLSVLKRGNMSKKKSWTHFLKMYCTLRPTRWETLNCKSTVYKYRDSSPRPTPPEKKKNLWIFRMLFLDWAKIYTMYNKRALPMYELGIFLIKVYNRCLWNIYYCKNDELLLLPVILEFFNFKFNNTANIARLAPTQKHENGLLYRNADNDRLAPKLWQARSPEIPSQTEQARCCSL